MITGPLLQRNARNMHTLEFDAVVAYKVLPLVEGAIEVNCQPHQLRKLGDGGNAEAEPVAAEDEVSETLTA